MVRRAGGLVAALLLVGACTATTSEPGVQASSSGTSASSFGGTIAPSSTAAQPSADFSATASAVATPVTSVKPADPNSEQSSTSAAPTTSAVSPAAPLPAVGMAGVNVPGCRSAERPVVLLHGALSTVASNFGALVPALLGSGRCVYALNYGNGGIGLITDSAGQFAGLVGTVLARSGARQVDVIGYSEGGLVLRTALRLDDLADRVANAVLIAPSFHGTTSSMAANAPAVLCPACADQVAGSALLQRLDRGGDLDGRVRYAVLSTRRDTVVTPVSSQVPKGPADRVRSILVEDRCPSLVTDHVQLPAVPGAISWALAALAADGRPSAAALTC